MDGRRGFTLIEVMIVIAIVGVLASTAIPGYLGYVSHSRENTVRINFDAAIKLIRGEIAKRNAGGLPALSTPTEFADSLNTGDKKSCYDPSISAFTDGGSGPGTVVITSPSQGVYQVTAYDGLGNPKAGQQVNILLE